MKTNPFEKITPCDVPCLVTKAYGKVAMVEKAVHGFAAAGIFPLDTEKFKEYEFEAFENLTNRLTDSLSPKSTKSEPPGFTQ